MTWAGSISPKAAKRANAKLKVLQGTRPQKGKMTTFENKFKDEGRTQQKAEVPGNHIDHPTNQRDRFRSLPSGAGRGKGGGAPSGIRATTSTGGQTTGGTKPGRRHIDAGGLQAKKWVPGSNVSASNPKTGNTRMKGTIAQRGPMFGGGGRATQ